MEGQYSIYDLFADKGAPCAYRFERFIGQRVICNGEPGTITEIEPYYTIVHTDTFRVLAATPYNLAPMEENE